MFDSFSKRRYGRRAWGWGTLGASLLLHGAVFAVVAYAPEAAAPNPARIEARAATIGEEPEPESPDRADRAVNLPQSERAEQLAGPLAEPRPVPETGDPGVRSETAAPEADRSGGGAAPDAESTDADHVPPDASRTRLSQRALQDAPEQRTLSRVFGAPDAAAIGTGALRAALPDTVRPGETYTVRLRLPRPDSAEWGEWRQSGISRVRHADLGADGFAVEPRAPALQLVDSTAGAAWEWVLTPREPGTGQVRLVLSAVAGSEGTERVHVVGAVRRDVVVEPSTPQRISRFVGKYWVWLSLIAVLPLAGWIRERRRRVRRAGAA